MRTAVHQLPQPGADLVGQPGGGAVGHRTAEPVQMVTGVAVEAQRAAERVEHLRGGVAWVCRTQAEGDLAGPWRSARSRWRDFSM